MNYTDMSLFIKKIAPKRKKEKLNQASNRKWKCSRPCIIYILDEKLARTITNNIQHFGKNTRPVNYICIIYNVSGSDTMCDLNGGDIGDI